MPDQKDHTDHLENEQSFFGYMTSQATSLGTTLGLDPDVKMAYKVLSWARTEGMNIYWGGQQSKEKSVLRVRLPDTNVLNTNNPYPLVNIGFAPRYGRIFSFDVGSMIQSPPFTTEVNRLELHTHLHQIPGVQLDKTRPRAWEGFALTNLSNGGVRKLFEETMWIRDQVTSAI